jgi:hypothetical protein
VKLPWNVQAVAWHARISYIKSPLGLQDQNTGLGGHWAFFKFNKLVVVVAIAVVALPVGLITWIGINCIKIPLFWDKWIVFKRE